MDPSVSIIIETWNPGDGAVILAAARGEVAEYDGPAEIVVVYDPTHASPEQLEWAKPADDGIPVRLVAAPGRRYYQMKNEGAATSRADVLVFADLDTQPDPGFLRALVAPLADPDVVIVSGITFVGPLRTRTDRIYASYWMFPATDPPGDPFPVERFMGNAFASRRDSWERLGGFPDDDRSRGQCRSLAFAIIRGGGVILRAPRARFQHPPPHDEGFVAQALRRGRDLHLSDAFGVAASPGSGKRWLGSARDYVRDVRDRAGALGLGPFDTTLAVGVSVVDMALVLAGARLTRYAPGFAARFRH